MSIETLLKEQRLYQYILDHSLRHSDLQKSMFDKAAKDAHANMNSAPEQVQFLGLLIKMLQAKKAIEIGVFRGFGTLGMALALPEDGKIYACDITDANLKDYLPYWEQAHVHQKIELCIAPAQATLEKLLQQGHGSSFDFAYIDADKQGYTQYYELCLQLLKSGGVMVFDNMLWGGDVANPSVQDVSTKAIRALNDKIHQDSRVEANLLPIGDGVNIVRKI